MVVDNSGSKVVSPAWKKNSGNKTKIFPAIYSPVLLLKFKEEVAGEYTFYGNSRQHESTHTTPCGLIILDYLLAHSLALSWETQWFLNKGDLFILAPFFSKKVKDLLCTTTCSPSLIIWLWEVAGVFSRWGGLHQILYITTLFWKKKINTSPNLVRKT